MLPCFRDVLKRSATTLVRGHRSTDFGTRKILSSCLCSFTGTYQSYATIPLSNLSWRRSLLVAKSSARLSCRIQFLQSYSPTLCNTCGGDILVAIHVPFSSCISSPDDGAEKRRWRDPSIHVYVNSACGTVAPTSGFSGISCLFIFSR